MQTEINLLSIDEAAPSETGERIRILIRLEEGGEAVLSIPAQEAVTLIDVTAAANARSEAITESADLPAAQVSWFELGEVQDGTGELYLTLTFGSGGRLTFLLEPVMASQLAAALHARMPQPG